MRIKYALDWPEGFEHATDVVVDTETGDAWPDGEQPRGGEKVIGFQDSAEPDPEGLLLTESVSEVSQIIGKYPVFLSGGSIWNSEFPITDATVTAHNDDTKD